MIYVVKRKGQRQEFDEKKVYASAYAACLNVHLSHEEAEGLAEKVSEKIKEWVVDKAEVTSHQIFGKVGEELTHLNTDAAFMYTTHRDLS